MNKPTNPDALPFTLCSGFLISMRDGTRYLIPVERMIERDINDTLNHWNPQVIAHDSGWPPATPKQAREWAESKFSKPIHPADIEELFAGTEWSEFADVAIKLPVEPLSPDDLWDETAVISFFSNNPAQGQQ